jgi:hypothetical protein
LTIISAVVLLAVIAYALTKAKKLSADASDDDRVLKKRTRTMVISVAAVLLIVSAGAGLMIFQGMQTVTYSVLNDKIIVKGIYGETIYYKDIVSKSIINKIPDIISRTNGSVIGNKFKGYFAVEKYGDVKLLADAGSPAFLLIKTNKQTTILSADNRAKLQEIFYMMEKAKVSLK